MFTSNGTLSLFEFDLLEILYYANKLFDMIPVLYLLLINLFNLIQSLAYGLFSFYYYLLIK
jgi:hypothetical protein